MNQDEIHPLLLERFHQGELFDIDRIYIDWSWRLDQLFGFEVFSYDFTDQQLELLATGSLISFNQSRGTSAHLSLTEKMPGATVIHTTKRITTETAHAYF